MYLKHKIYSYIFNCLSRFPLVENQISFILDSNNSFKGNLDYIYKEFQKRGDFQYNFFYKDKFSFKALKKLATSKYIFLNDNFFPIAFMNFKDDVKIIQLWHAPGAFKKFGASSSSNEQEIEMISKFSSKTSYLITTSDSIADYYADAFRIDKSKIKALGIPRMDFYFNNINKNQLRKKFNSKYPIAKDKKIILYAPTFRDDEEKNDIFNFLDLEEFNRELGEDYILAIRLHPKIKNFYRKNLENNSEFINCSDWENEQELLVLADILITDYSSIMIEYAALNKPIIFFTYDLDTYITKDRGFYYDFEKNVPGTIVKNTEQLIRTIKNKDFSEEKTKEFLSKQFNRIDGEASKRIVDFVLRE